MYLFLVHPYYMSLMNMLLTQYNNLYFFLEYLFITESLRTVSAFLENPVLKSLNRYLCILIVLNEYNYNYYTYKQLLYNT